jgi:hypothetical protein
MHGNYGPKMVGSTDDPDSFLIIPLTFNEEESHQVTSDTDSLLTREESKPVQIETLDSEEDVAEIQTQEYEELMLSTTRVAIAYQQKDGSFRYLSCRREIPWSARSLMVEYRPLIGEFETFKVEYDFCSNSYSFQSHNGLFLYNSTMLGIVGFKEKKSESTRWIIDASDSVLQTKIAYLGVLRFEPSMDSNTNGIHTLMETLAPGLPFDRDHFNTVVRVLREVHTEKQKEDNSEDCWVTHFEVKENGTQWVAKVDKDSVCFLLIAAMRYPKFVAFECIDDLQALFDGRYKKYHSGNQAPSEETRARQAKQLFAQRMHYEDLEGLWKSSEVPEDLRVRMQSNFNNLMGNIEREESILRAATQLNADALVFHRKSTDLRRKTSITRRQLAMITLGVSSGAAIGWLVGGPAGAFALASQEIEIVLGTACGLVGAVTLNYGYDCMQSFWRCKFVPVANKIEFRLKRSPMKRKFRQTIDDAARQARGGRGQTI